VRFDRLTPREKDYLRAMAELGPGPHRSGDIADMLGVKVESVAPLRSSLLRKGMIYSPQHGDTAFTVPLFDQFMKRVMPDSQAPELIVLLRSASRANRKCILFGRTEDGRGPGIAGARSSRVPRGASSRARDDALGAP